MSYEVVLLNFRAQTKLWLKVINLTLNMPKNQCSVCDSESFENVDGFYYCTICNTQAQVKYLEKN